MSRIKMNRGLAVVASTIAMSVAPAAAFAVNVSSNDGSGTQSVRTWYPNGAYMVGTLKSTKGSPVYFSGVIVEDNYPDVDFGRYTTDTSSTTAVTKNGLLGSSSTSGTPRTDGVKVKICRNRNNLPDPCGSYTATFRHP